MVNWLSNHTISFIFAGIHFVTFEGWERINKEEIRKGVAIGKPREKITSRGEMLEYGVKWSILL